MNQFSQHSLFARDTYWRSIWVFALYRIAIAVIILVSHIGLKKHAWLTNYDSDLYFTFALAYLAFSLFAAALTWFKWPSLDRQVMLQILADIGFIVLLMFAAGGLKSGIGLLTVIAIASVSLISEGRLALFYASIATIALLLEQTYQLVTWDQEYDDYTQAVMLSLSYFATAWLAHSFAQRTNLSERLASQQKVDLENLGQINALITEEMQDGVLVVDGNFQLKHHNEQANELLHIQLEVAQDHALDFYIPELGYLIREWMNSPPDQENNVFKLASTDRELKVRFLPISSYKNQGVVVFIEDWTQMQAQAQQLKLAALGQLTANIAHEIRNPLSAISHATQLLQEDPEQDPTSTRMLQIITDNVERMEQMVRDILELNRRDRTKQEKISLQAFLKEFHEQFCTTEKIPTTHFILVPELTSAEILFDQRHLHQILWNLCRNGWRHCQQKEESLALTLRSSSRGRNLYVEVVDDGPGIPADIQAHLFEPFFTTETTGTGLGLYIARELCEANSASLRYTGLNPGSLFTIQVKKLQKTKS